MATSAPDPDLTARLQALREEYTAGGLAEADLAADPMTQFRRWLDEAIAAQSVGLVEPNAMVLSTIGPTGGPESRTVLLKGLDERGFVFFTNHRSDKGNQLSVDPRCALHFGWYALERQVRVVGEAEIIDRAETEAYFATRPRASQIGAWASPQSRLVADRAALEEAYAEAAQTYGGVDGTDSVPAPPHWGGYRVLPSSVEFWQGRVGRMHDRLRYHDFDGAWEVERLAP